MINSPRRPGPLIPIMRNRDEPTEWEFHENLVPGQTYSVLGKTVSGKVTSWPATVNVTLSQYILVSFFLDFVLIKHC